MKKLFKVACRLIVVAIELTSKIKCARTAQIGSSIATLEVSQEARKIKEMEDGVAKSKQMIRVLKR